jgi:hypothetical protein
MIQRLAAIDAPPDGNVQIFFDLVLPNKFLPAAAAAASAQKKNRPPPEQPKPAGPSARDCLS